VRSLSGKSTIGSDFIDLLIAFCNVVVQIENFTTELEAMNQNKTNLVNEKCQEQWLRPTLLAIWEVAATIGR
jgi:hypothetical protein